MNLSLQERSVLVTGGSRGIGRAIALAYAAEGARVTVTFNSNERAAAATVEEIESAGGTAAAVPMDLGNPASIDSAVELSAKRYRGLDVLVANAVRWPTDAAGPLAESEPDVWQNALRTNLEGTAATVRAAWPWLRGSGQGRIVFISTGVTRHGMAGASAYAAAKAGLEGLVAALKWEGADSGILCNLVAPGFTVTEANLARFPDEVREGVRARTPSGRLSVPEDVAPAVVFLGSPANTNITGCYLPVAGGTD
jgi:NAD(P)-dependent dehydrogenase (short-subunit alcohol dehydrogenase family)